MISTAVNNLKCNLTFISNDFVLLEGAVKLKRACIPKLPKKHNCSYIAMSINQGARFMAERRLIETGK